MRGLYLHIPFCYQKCYYCNFVISTRHLGESRKNYLSALSNEITYVSQKYGALFFDTFYLGGGTPSLLPTDEIESIVREIKLAFHFPPHFEFTLEVNPKDVTCEKALAWRALGINRISLGAQAFQDRILEQLGRDHRAADIEKSVLILKNSGFENVSLDLICRLPGQSPQDFVQSVQNSIKLNPAQVTIYDLEVHDKTVFGFWQKKGKLQLPDESQHIEMLELAECILEVSELKRYEIANFAKPGFESKHNLIYWNNEEYLGLGPGAFSYLNRERYQFANDVSSYVRKCLNRDFSYFEYDCISNEKEEIESLLTGLRLIAGFDLKRAPILSSKIMPKLPSFIKEGLISKENNRICLTVQGRRVYESLISRLLEDAYKEG